jgi:hypothetical protein
MITVFFIALKLTDSVGQSYTMEDFMIGLTFTDSLEELEDYYEDYFDEEDY